MAKVSLGRIGGQDEEEQGGVIRNLSGTITQRTRSTAFGAIAKESNRTDRTIGTPVRETEQRE
jgi:hypothetical protein